MSASPRDFPWMLRWRRGERSSTSSRQAEWATPVLYLRAKDGMLFAPASEDPPVAGAAAMSRAAQGLRAPTAPAAEDDPWGAGEETSSVSSWPHLTRTWKRSTDNSPTNSRVWTGCAWWTRSPGTIASSTTQQSITWSAARISPSICLARHPGKRLDDDDPPDTLKTYQLEQLSIGLKAASPTAGRHDQRRQGQHR